MVLKSPKIFANRIGVFKHAKVLLFILPIVLFGDSCKKHGFGSVEGTVIEETTGLPVPDARVDICKAFHHNTCFPLKKTETDGNGHFKIKYYNSSSSVYDLTASADDSYNSAQIVHISGRKSNYTLTLTMKAFVRITLKNNRSEGLRVSASTDAEDKPNIGPIIIDPNQTKTFSDIMRVKVGYPTKIMFSAQKSFGYASTTINIDTTVVLTQKLDTLLYFATIN